MTSASPGTIQQVRTDAGYHGRVIGGNNEPVWTTEVHGDPREVVNAVLVFIATVKGTTVDTFGLAAEGIRMVEVDERTDTTPPEAFKP
jgi:hypothetical protein